jgi:hypothetical protein
LQATDGSSVTLASLPGRTVLFAYPRTGEPGKIGLVDDWDMISAARGCTPQTCAFRDLFKDLKDAVRSMCSDFHSGHGLSARHGVSGCTPVSGFCPTPILR